jgi:hypothetical protein
MPRPTYESDKDRENERQIAAAFAMWSKTTAVKMNGDYAPIDHAFIRQITDPLLRLVVALAECKDRSHRFNLHDTWKVSARKIERMRHIKEILKLPVYCVVRFGCGTIAWLDPCRAYTPEENWGRDDRGDPADKETAACFKWDQFGIIKEGLPRDRQP